MVEEGPHSWDIIYTHQSSNVEGLSKWEANNHGELEVHHLVTFLLIDQSPKEKEYITLWKLDFRCSQWKRVHCPLQPRRELASWEVSPQSGSWSDMSGEYDYSHLAAEHGWRRSLFLRHHFHTSEQQCGGTVKVGSEQPRGAGGASST